MKLPPRFVPLGIVVRAITGSVLAQATACSWRSRNHVLSHESDEPLTDADTIVPTHGVLSDAERFRHRRTAAEAAKQQTKPQVFVT